MAFSKKNITKNETMAQCYLRRPSPTEQKRSFDEISDKQYGHDESAQSIKIFWETPSDIDNIDEYMVKYKDKKERKFLSQPVDKALTEVTIDNLPQKTHFDVRMYLVTDGEERMYFQFECSTEENKLSETLKSCAVINEAHRPQIYKLSPVSKTFCGDCPNVEMYKMFSDDQTESRFTEGKNVEKNILLVGATGCGKSTMVHALVNYIAGVSCSDDFRIHISDRAAGDTIESKDQTVSQTSRITCYKIPMLEGSRINCRVNIIDTPGFNDTNGKEFDKKLPEYMHGLFEHFIEHIDAVCIVVSVSDKRLTEAQQYVFKNILNLFGKDIEENILIIITHNDGEDQPSCIQALEKAKIPCKKQFRFSNSELFSPYATIFKWKENERNFSKLFETLSNLQKKSVESSKSVLEARVQLSIQLERFQDKLRTQIEKINSSIFKPEGGSDDTIDVRVYERVSKKCINCKICKETCHPGCWIPPLQMFVGLCFAIKNNKCTVCRCSKKDHTVEKYEYVTKIQIKPHEDFLKTMNTKSTADEEFQRRSRELHDSLLEIKSLVNKLKSIALSPEKITYESYIVELIRKENYQKEINFEKRINGLEQIKEGLERGDPIDKIIENYASSTLYIRN